MDPNAQWFMPHMPDVTLVPDASIPGKYTVSASTIADHLSGPMGSSLDALKVIIDDGDTDQTCLLYTSDAADE